MLRDIEIFMLIIRRSNQTTAVNQFTHNVLQTWTMTNEFQCIFCFCFHLWYHSSQLCDCGFENNNKNREETTSKAVEKKHMCSMLMFSLLLNDQRTLTIAKKFQLKTIKML